MLFTQSIQAISLLLAATATAYPFPGTAIVQKQPIPGMVGQQNVTNQTAPAVKKVVGGPLLKRNETNSEPLVEKRNETVSNASISSRNVSALAEEVESVKSAILRRNETADALNSIAKRNESSFDVAAPPRGGNLFKRNETIDDPKEAAATPLPNVVRRDLSGTGVVPPKYT